MTRSKAIDRVRKLQAVTVARGATANEEAVAKAKADELIARFELLAAEIIPEPIRRTPIVAPPAWPWGFVVQPGFSATTNASSNVWIQFG